MAQVSDFERGILQLLQRNGRMPNVELARRLNISETPCLRRVRQLEEAGVITGYRAVLDQRKLGLQLSAFVMINTDQRTETDRKLFVEAVMREPGVISCAAVSGSHDFLLEVVARDIEDLAELTMVRLLGLPSVSDIASSIVLRWIKRNEPLPV